MEIAIRTAEQAASYLEGLIDVEKRRDFSYERLGLDAIGRLLARAGNPERGLRVIHIAGSKGKGSTALLAEALLQAAGRRAGTFTSPHLSSWTERFRIDGREVAGEQLAAAVAALRPHVDALRAEDPRRAPTWFDATTAAALWLFREGRVDAAILEVGLGGRLDSTNAVAPAVACVTSIELEHTAQLGGTLAEIAREKAGILKPGVPAVAGSLPPEARDALASRAAELGVRLAWLGRDFHVETLSADARGLRLRLEDGPVAVEARLPVLGTHQAVNAALALACVRRSGALDDAELAGAACRGFATAALPGRVELLGRDPWLVVDGAHTAASARALAAALAVLPHRRAHLVLSVSAGKALAEILRALLPLASEVTATRAEPARSLSPEAVAAVVRELAPGVPLHVVPNPQLALRAARAALGPGDLLCAAGSVYLAGIARRVLRDAHAAARVAVGRARGRGSVVGP